MGESEQEQERKPTERVVLQMLRVIVVPDCVEDGQLAGALDALYPKARRGLREAVVVDAWSPVATVAAATKLAAIEAHAGKPGTADAKQGTFRAPSSTAWKGAVVMVAPPAPLVERMLLD